MGEGHLKPRPVRPLRRRIMPKIVKVDMSGRLSVQEWRRADLDKFAEKQSMVATWRMPVAAEGGKEEAAEYRLYASKEGDAGSENKYEFPPPADSSLFFGECAVAKFAITSNPTRPRFENLSLSEWEKTVETLYGGFEDIGDTSSCDEADAKEDRMLVAAAEKEELAANLSRTRHGYVRDGFVVDDDDDNDDNDDESEEEEKKPKMKKTAVHGKKRSAATNEEKDKKKKTEKKQKKSSVATASVVIGTGETSKISDVFDHSDELYEEPYFA